MEELSIQDTLQQALVFKHTLGREESGDFILWHAYGECAQKEHYLQSAGASHSGWKYHFPNLFLEN